MKKNLKKLTLLHSNDFHGDFLAEKVDEKLVGGVSRLSGYINKVRDEEKNVIYAIAGDMFRGSLIDSEFQGISTFQIMNLLAPDVVSLGNHEVDYGLAHLLFLEKCASFPIICANMYVKYIGKRLFSSHWIKEIDGMRVLFIGILTKEVLSNTKNDGLIGMLIDLEDAVSEVGKRPRGQVGNKAVSKVERLRVLEMVQAAVTNGVSSVDDGFDAAKRAFNEECKNQVEAVKRATSGLDNSFSFLDDAFGENSQESLIYVTKLSADPVLIRLVSEHGSAEFMKHNKSLLFTERGLELLEEIKGLEQE